MAWAGQLVRACWGCAERCSPLCSSLLTTLTQGEKYLSSVSSGCVLPTWGSPASPIPQEHCPLFSAQPTCLEHLASSPGCRRFIGAGEASLHHLLCQGCSGPLSRDLGQQAPSELCIPL